MASKNQKKKSAAKSKTVRPKARPAPRGAGTRAAAPLEQQLKRSVNALWDLQESELYMVVGNQLALTQREIATRDSLSAMKPATGLPQDTARLAAAPAWLKELGERFERKFNAQMYSLVCDKNDPDNAKVIQAGMDNAEKLALILAGTMVATFGWMPAIASALAVIVAKRLARSGHEALCEVWEKSVKK